MAPRQKNVKKVDYDLEPEEPDEYEVEEVIDSRNIQGQTEYLLKWRGYPIEEATWEPEENCTTCRDLIAAFEARKAPNLDSFDFNEQDLDNKKDPFEAQNEKLFSKRKTRTPRKLPVSPTSTSTSRSPRSANLVTCEWEQDIEHVVTVKFEENTLLVKIKWKDGRLNESPASEVHRKAPLKLLEYYESKLRWGK